MTLKIILTTIWQGKGDVKSEIFEEVIQHVETKKKT